MDVITYPCPNLWEPVLLEEAPDVQINNWVALTWLTYQGSGAGVPAGTLKTKVNTCETFEVWTTIFLAQVNAFFNRLGAQCV